MSDLELLFRCVQLAGEEKTPFAAAMVFGSGEVFYDVNTTHKDTYVHHAEMNVLLKSDRYDTKSSKTLISTCEPCPMCMGGAIWSRVDKVVYAVSIETLKAYMPQINVSAEQIVNNSFKKIELVQMAEKPVLEELLRYNLL